LAISSKKNSEHSSSSVNSADGEMGAINSKNFTYTVEKKSIVSKIPLQIAEEDLGKERIVKRKASKSEEISKSELKELIEKNRDIDEITIENLKFNESNRYKINFQKKFDHNNQSKLKNLEVKINAEFLGLSFKHIDNKKSHDQETKLLDLGDNEAGKTSSLKTSADVKGNTYVVEYEKHSLKRNTIHVKVEEVYYKIKNHKDLYNLGKSYLKDLSEGSKCFGLGYVNDKQMSVDTILGLGSYFRYHTNLRVCCLIDVQRHLEALESHLGAGPVTNLKSFSEELQMDMYSTTLMDMIDIHQMERSNIDFRDLVKKIYNSYDVVFVELPEVSSMDQKRNLFFPLVNILDNISLILKFKDSTYSAIEKEVEFFKKYDVKVKGVLLS
jgi:hypothetical protein